MSNKIFLSLITIGSMLGFSFVGSVYAQTNNSTNLIQAMQKAGKIIDKTTNILNNLNKTVTVEDCIKTRQMYPGSHNMTIHNPILGKFNFNPLDIQIKACKEAGK